MRYFEILNETVIAESFEVPSPKVLFHGTIIQNVPTIMATGLEPRVGRNTAVFHKSSAVPLVYAADEDDWSSVVCAITLHMNATLKRPKVKNWRGWTKQDIAKYGAIVIVDGKDFQHRPYSIKNPNSGVAFIPTSDGDYPIGTEPGDYYSTKPVKAIGVIRGHELVNWIEKHGKGMRVADYDPLSKNITEGKINAETVIAESFDNALPFKWTHKSERQWLAYFKAGKNRYKILIARRKNPNVGSSWELEFVQVSTSFFGSETVRSDITVTGLAFSILSTIIASAREFLKEVRPDILYFSSKEESRTKLYSALFSRLKKSLVDYNFSTIAHPVEAGSLLFIIKQKNGLEESARIDETVVGYHGSRAGDPVFKIGHSGNNAHTFGAYDSQRYGAFFSDNPKFAALYGNVKKYALNIHDTADLNTPHIRQDFIESLDPFDPVDRPFWLTVRHATGQTWQLFEDQLGERFTKFLLDNGYDSATFTEYNEDSEGNEFKSNTIVVLKPELIQETKLTESISLNESAITREELLSKYPGIEGDLADVDGWLHGVLTYRLEIEPTKKFAAVAENILKALDKFPKDRARINKIMRLLKAGAPQRPIFCDTHDNWIMEGRHRIVAFHLLKLPTTPVVYVSIDRSKVTETAEILLDKLI